MVDRAFDEAAALSPCSLGTQLFHVGHRSEHHSVGVAR